MESTNKTKVVFRRWNDTNEVIAIFQNIEVKRETKKIIGSFRNKITYDFCSLFNKKSLVGLETILQDFTPAT